MGKVKVPFSMAHDRKEVDDLSAVILHFGGQKRGISAIVGHSKGGNAVLLYASTYHDISTVVNVSGCFALGSGIEGLGKYFIVRIKKDGFIDVKDPYTELLYRVTEKSLMDRLNHGYARFMCIDRQELQGLDGPWFSRRDTSS